MKCEREILSMVVAAAIAAGVPAMANAQTPPPAPPPTSTQTPAQTPSSTQTYPPPSQPPAITQRVEVITTKLPELPEDVPASVDVISGDELRSRGASSLRDALALAAGVVIAPGGDNGPAGSVPEFWGLREFDAFLLVVDGVPWGGAFNPALTTLNLRDVDHIEILRGAAPVTFGATSFVGVIHVVHKAGANADRMYFDLHGGTPRTGGASLDVPFRTVMGWSSRLSFDADHVGFDDPRTSFGRGHALFRAMRGTADRSMWFTIDMNVLRQHPGSPTPVDGTALSTVVPIDANANPAGAFMHDNRFSASWGMQRQVHKTWQWVTTASFSHASQSLFRGFLTTDTDVADNAQGLRQNIHLTDLYADSHIVVPVWPHVRLVAGGDFLHGLGNSVGAVFSYTTPIDGSSAASIVVPGTLDLGNEDRREFMGGYGLIDWQTTPRLTINAGIRANVTIEERGGSPAEEAAAKAAGQKDHPLTHGQPSGSVGAMYRFWDRGANFVRAFADYRGTFKPAAFDFGLGTDAGGVDPDKTLLDPETAQSLEAGVKTRWADGKIDVNASVFRMDFHNLVTSTVIGGLPALQNSGKTRFEGFEASIDGRLPHAMSARASYSFHNARYVDFTTLVDGTSTQLAGNRFEMSARHLLSAGFVLAPDRGIVASVVLNVTGDRYLDEINTALAPRFVTIDAGGGYRIDKLELRADVKNIGNRRDPVALSELGDGQVYRMIGRIVAFTMGMKF